MSRGTYTCMFLKECVLTYVDGDSGDGGGDGVRVVSQAHLTVQIERLDP